jgi:ribosomal protein L15
MHRPSKLTPALAVAFATALVLSLSAAPALAKAKPKDSNHNGIPNSWEAKYHLSKAKNQAKVDFDKDGLNNLNEYRAGTNPRKKDSDHDGVADGLEDRDRDGLVNLAEVRAGTSLKTADTDKDGELDCAEDPDYDGLDNADEWDCGTNPKDADSDDDGTTDADEDADEDGLDNDGECAQGSDPRDSDSDDDGVEDCDEVGGYIVNFDAATGVLTLRTFRSAGATIAVTVDASTTIEWDCDDESTVATLGDLAPGVIAKEIEVQTLADGTLKAIEIELKRAESEHEAIAKIKSFDASTGALALEAEDSDDCEYTVLVDSATVLEWDASVSASTAPTTGDLIERTRVMALETVTAADGSLTATRIVLKPHPGKGHGGGDGDRGDED